MGDEGAEYGFDLVFRECAGELLDELAVLDDFDRGDALHPQGEGELLVGVNVDFGEGDGGAECGDYCFENRAKRFARLAPRSPKIDDDDALLRAVQNELFKVLFIDVEDLRLGLDFHDVLSVWEKGRLVAEFGVIV